MFFMEVCSLCFCVSLQVPDNALVHRRGVPQMCGHAAVILFYVPSFYCGVPVSFTVKFRLDGVYFLVFPAKVNEGMEISP